MIDLERSLNVYNIIIYLDDANTYVVILIFIRTVYFIVFQFHALDLDFAPY